MCNDNALAVLEAPYIRGDSLPSDLACLWRVMGAIVANQGLLKTVRPLPKPHEELPRQETRRSDVITLNVVVGAGASCRWEGSYGR